MQKYSPATEESMKIFHGTLNEKDKRRYAAHEANKLGHGGVVYIAALLKINRNTVMAGQKELEIIAAINREPATGRIRIIGGGRKQKIKTVEKIEEIFLKVLKNHTAGDPMDEHIVWTDLTHKEIAVGMKDEGISISVTVIKKLLKKHGYVKRKMQKSEAMGINKDRDAQFKNIEKLRAEYEDSDNPIVSVDTKKKNY